MRPVDYIRHAKNASPRPRPHPLLSLYLILYPIKIEIIIIFVVVVVFVRLFLPNSLTTLRLCYTHRASFFYAKQLAKSRK